MNGAEVLLRTAKAAGVDVCFANPGTTEMPLVAALDAVDGIRAVLGLFEGVCTGAADGFGRMSGRPAMTLLHLGPGLANGLANLHNARRAGSPVVNLVGDHSVAHLAFDSPLKSDIATLAATTSAWVRTSRDASALCRDLAQAVSAATVPPGQIATLIVPADVQSAPASSPAPVLPTVSARAPDRARVAAAVAALRRGNTTALFLGGPACLAPALGGVARIADASACRVLVECFPARMERGAGTPLVERFGYFPEQIPGLLSGVDRVILAGTADPIAMFRWPQAESRMLPEEVEVLSLASAGEDVAAALAAVADELGAPPRASGLARYEQPVAPSGPLDVSTLAAAVAATLPDNAIVVDEGATSSVALYPALSTAAPHSWLTLTGGAIGQGLPCATGAAIACPDRKVVSFQADGSGLYTLQALWTQARESLDVTTVVCANRAYRILQYELMRAGIMEPGRAARSLTDLGAPELDWVSLSQGMGVPAVRVENAETLVRELRRGLSEPGPHLIEALLA